MSSGKVHARIAGLVGVGVAVTAFGLIARGQVDLAVGLSLGSIAGAVVTPDIDQEATTLEEIRMYQIAPPLGWAWQWAWYGYAKAFPHRGISHAAFIGTLTRVGYALLLLIMLRWMAMGIRVDWCAIHGCEPWPAQVGFVWLVPPLAVVGFLGGWMLQDLGHIVADKSHPIFAVMGILALWVVVFFIGGGRI